MGFLKKRKKLKAAHLPQAQLAQGLPEVLGRSPLAGKGAEHHGNFFEIWNNKSDLFPENFTQFSVAQKK